MKRFNLLCFLGVFCVIGATYAQQPPTRSWEILRPGTTDNYDSPLEPGTGWLALRNTKNGWELFKTTVTAKKVKHEAADYGIEISSKHKDALVLLRNLHLTEGVVPTPQGFNRKRPISFSKIDNKFPSLKITFNDKPYDFKVVRQKHPRGYKDDDGQELFVYPILVQSGEKSTNIGAAGDGGFGDYVSVAWIGDLDHDGNLDLITHEDGSHYGGYCVRLSSDAKGNELFGGKQCHISSGG